LAATNTGLFRSFDVGKGNDFLMGQIKILDLHLNKFREPDTIWAGTPASGYW
jgi:hypothetical protein